MRLAAIVDDEIGHPGLVALGDGELSASSRLVEGGDLQRHARPALQPDDEQLAVRLPRPHPHVLDESPEVRARLAGGAAPLLFRNLGRNLGRDLR